MSKLELPTIGQPGKATDPEYADLCNIPNPEYTEWTTTHKTSKSGAPPETVTIRWRTNVDGFVALELLAAAEQTNAALLPMLEGMLHPDDFVTLKAAGLSPTELMQVGVLLYAAVAEHQGK